MVAIRGSRSAPRPPIFGREEIREEAERLLSRTLGGAGGGLLLSGPGGVGKTQIMNGLIELAGKRGCTVLSGRALPEELPPAFSLLRELLGSDWDRGSGAGAPAPLWTPSQPPLLMPVLADRAELSTAGAPGATTEAPSDDFERLLAPIRLTPAKGSGAGRDELFADLERHLLDRAKERPLLIAVDDLHFADTSTLEFFLRFGRELPTASIAITATLAETADIPERTREAIEALSGAPNFLTIPVRALNVPETEEFVRWILGGRAADRDDVRRWHAQTDGNPLFLEQLVRLATGYAAPRAARRPAARESPRSSSNGSHVSETASVVSSPTRLSSERSSISPTSRRSRGAGRSGSRRASTASSMTASSARRAARSTSS